MARAMGLDRMEISLPKGFHVSNAAPKSRVISRVTSGGDTGDIPVCRGNEINKHFFPYLERWL
jgi:hypothetical protein